MTEIQQTSESKYGEIRGTPLALVVNATKDTEIIMVSSGKEMPKAPAIKRPEASSKSNAGLFAT